MEKSLKITILMLLFLLSCQKKTLLPENYKNQDIKNDMAAKDDEVECINDDDCVAINDGCCNCNEGGKQRAVKKSELYKEVLEDDPCEDTVCPAVISKDPSCYKKDASCPKEGEPCLKKAVCRKGKCVLE